MKVALVSDIHGNAPALAAVCDDIGSAADFLLCAGDFAGYYPFVEECLVLWRS
ncbi:MAG: metallophosphoesterase family protein, partial [Acidimicrobiales bacterium]|nr:metallophosphoesterase family protein [Acidimicrobiales bacterium]